MKTNIRPIACISLAAVAAAMLLGIAGCSSKPSKPSQPGQFTSEKDKFSISAPPHWEKAENFMNTAVLFKEPLSGPSDNFTENVNVVVESLPADMNLDAYVKISRENMAKMLTGFAEESSTRTTLGPNDAHRGVYVHKMGVYDLKVLYYVVVKNKRGYSITCSSTAGEFDKHLPIFEDICKSFETN